MKSIRRSVATELRFEGRGLHSGSPVSVTIFPGDRGIAFRSGSARTLAIAENVSDTRRCTRLGDVSTIEHLMAAFACIGITDAEVEVVGGELPALDGSAAPYVEALLTGGMTQTGSEDLRLPFKRVYHHDGALQIAMAAGSGHWRYSFETGDRWPGSMVFESEDVVSDFRKHIAPARTIAFEEQVEQALAAGLGRGLDAESVVVMGQEGYVNAARFPDEPARHKLLDAIGDLYLSGIPPQFLNVTCVRSGHTAHVAAAHLLRQHVQLAS